MFIKVRDNIHEGPIRVLAVNLAAYQRVIVKPNGELFQLALEIPGDHSINIQAYQSSMDAIKAFENLVEAMENGEQVWTAPVP